MLLILYFNSYIELHNLYIIASLWYLKVSINISLYDKHMFNDIISSKDLIVLITSKECTKRLRVLLLYYVISYIKLRLFPIIQF